MEQARLHERLDIDSFFQRRTPDSDRRDVCNETHYLLQCHRIALDFGSQAAEVAMELFAESNDMPEGTD